MVFFNSRSVLRKALECSCNPVPWINPQRGEIVRARQDAFDLRQDQFIAARLIIDRPARKLSRQRRANIRGRVRSLNRDAGADAFLRAHLGKVSSFGGGNQLVAQFQRPLAVEHGPDGQHAVSVEVIVGNEIDPAR